MYFKKKFNGYVVVKFDCWSFVSEVDPLLARDPLVEVSILQSILSFVPRSNLIGLHLVVPKSYANVMAVIFGGKNRIIFFRIKKLCKEKFLLLDQNSTNRAMRDLCSTR